MTSARRSTRWLDSALDYIPRYIDHQMRLAQQPGCTVAIAHHGQLVFERAWGLANLQRGEVLQPRHRFRVASHSKTFTAAAVLKLQEQGRLRLDDPVGRHVDGLHRQVGDVTLAQLLSHGAGVVRDGEDAGQWSQRRPFLDEAALRRDLARGLVLEAQTRFKYSNHGFGLVGLAIASVTGEPYVDWVRREIVQASGLRHTEPDAPLAAKLPLAQGHSGTWPVGQRLVIPSNQSTHALASATGFVSTAGDLASYFASLDPAARRSVISRGSRLAMWHRHWKDPHNSVERWYGLGSMSGSLDGSHDWLWWGHTGGFPGTITRTAHVPAQGLTVSVLTNAADGPSHAWADAILHLLRMHQHRGAPSRRTSAWQGRWWSLWGAMDLVPVDGDRVLVLNPAQPSNPMLDAQELQVTSPRDARIALAGGFMSHGEPAEMRRDARGRATAFRLAGTWLKREGDIARELRHRYAAKAHARKR